MEEQIKKIQENTSKSIKQAQSKQELNDIRVKVLGKKGELTLILRSMGSLSAEERPIVGNKVNEAKKEIEELITQKEKELKIVLNLFHFIVYSF